MASALIIGIGSSGLHIIEEAQQFYYELTGNNKPDGVEYMYLETDINQLSKNTASGSSDIDRLFVSLKHNQATINSLKNSNNPDTSWIPSPQSVLNNQNGAGGMSSYGRLSLWGNFNQVRTMIRDKYSLINGNNTTRIFIVGTLTGGTGSGLCVDMPYLVSQTTLNNNIFGIFLTPDRNSITDATKRPLFINYFNSIASISHFSEQNNNFSIQWPGAGIFNSLRPPYSQVQLLSQDFDNADAPLNDVNGLYRIAGLNLMTRFLGFDKVDTQNIPIRNYSDLYDARMVDVKSNEPEFKFSTFGISMIQYPKSQIEELFAIDLSIDMINRWLDTVNYKDKTGKTITIIGHKAQLKFETIKEFDDDLDLCFKMIDGKNAPNGSTYKASLSKIVSNIMTNDFEGKANPNAYIYDKLSNNNSSNHYLTLANYRIDIRDNLIKAIQNRIVNYLDSFQNIDMCKMKLSNISEAIDSIVKYWKEKYNITEDVAIWNSVLQAKIKEMFVSTSAYYVCRQKKNYLEEQLNNIFTLAKMHISIEVLLELKLNLNQPTAYLFTNSSREELPSIKRLNEFRVNLENAIKNSISNPSFSDRKAELTADLNNNTNQIIRLFEHGSLENDLNQSNAKYGQGSNKINYKDYTNNTSIWDYLLKNESIYTDYLKNSVTYVQNNNLVSNINIVDLIKQTAPTDPQYTKIQIFVRDSVGNIVQKLPGMIHLDNTKHQFQPHACLKTVILTSNINSLRPLLTYKATGTDESIELPELQNAIIYQQEYGYMGAVNPSAFHPLTHIGYNKTIVSNVLNPEIQNQGDNFFEKRVPYLSKAIFNRIKDSIV